MPQNNLIDEYLRIVTSVRSYVEEQMHLGIGATPASEKAGSHDKDPVSLAVYESMDEIRTAVEGCQACPLHETRTNTVFGEGNEDAGLVFVGEAPGADEDKQGVPKFLGVDRTAEGFARNGFPIGLGYDRAYSGCHWSAIPGREYTLNDCVKINFARVFEVAWDEMMLVPENGRSVDNLWQLFTSHLRIGIEGIAASLDYHLDHMYKVFPELVMDLLCFGTIEKGLDASHGGVEFYNLCLDGAALATVADSFAALKQRIEVDGRISWVEIQHYISTNWEGLDGTRARMMMRNIPRYGTGGAEADAYAQRITQTFTEIVKETPTPNGFNIIPGLFSWANTIPMGKAVGATPNGRQQGDPISHGANPDPGFRKDGAPTAMAVAIASVQPGYGNTAPMQMELDPALSKDEGGIDHVANLIKTHFDLGGTQINLNIMDAEAVMEAHKDPTKYPDLVVRVTGFSAYFASLSPEFRQLVVDRIISEN